MLVTVEHARQMCGASSLPAAPVSPYRAACRAFQPATVLSQMALSGASPSQEDGAARFTVEHLGGGPSAGAVAVGHLARRQHDDGDSGRRDIAGRLRVLRLWLLSLVYAAPTTSNMAARACEKMDPAPNRTGRGDDRASMCIAWTCVSNWS
jgi:hypothetical protein